MEFIYNCRRLNSKYFVAPKSGLSRCGPPAVAGWFLRHWSVTQHYCNH